MFMLTNCFGKEKNYTKEKVAKLHFYVQDLRIGHVSATVSEVATASVTKDSPYDFGSVHVLDDLVTAEPAIDSRPIGRVQGLTTNADLSTYGIAMNLNFHFTAGKFAGSQLSILGRNQVMDCLKANSLHDSREIRSSSVINFFSHRISVRPLLIPRNSASALDRATTFCFLLLQHAPVFPLGNEQSSMPLPSEQDDKRELPVVGGTGAFRFTRGYAIQTTYSIDFPAHYAVLEYTVYATYDSEIGKSDEDVEVFYF
ncbi:dirigent protein 21-like [Salvia splendens]|uniref:dirigent protein 21-like n=1 Tax=Salvia splendens TaxID=180675 RepID=UPI001C2703F3|nr:dirigent protein 21-like [Salvia splendens]